MTTIHDGDHKVKKNGTQDAADLARKLASLNLLEAIKHIRVVDVALDEGWPQAAGLVLVLNKIKGELDAA